MTLAKGTQLGHYEVIEAAGSGGMGEVYRGYDRRLDRAVAIKVLKGDLPAKEEARRRFDREARAIAALSHPNIVAIYDIGSTGNTDYLVIEFLEGETLRERISRGPVAWPKAIDAVASVFDGLAAAHNKGIVHRDVKPENIFITADGWVKILDFGVAYLTAAGGTDSDRATTEAKATGEGHFVGTVRYMSPEQLRGLPADARTDIFSLGCVLHELLTGRSPFARDSTAETIASILSEEPPEIRDANPSVPPAVSQIARRCLEKNREERFQSARDVAFALRLAASKPSETFGALHATAEKSIAVLPFVNMSSDPENEYFSDGISEEIISALTLVPGLSVASRTSTFALKGRLEDVRAIGQRLKVRCILEGSVRKVGDRLRIIADLVNVEDGYHLWSGKFDRQLKDVFAIQDEITQTIVDRLRIEFFGDRAAARPKRYTSNVEAYNWYLRALYEKNRGTPDGYRKATEFYRHTVDLEPGDALAYAGIAECYSAMAAFGLMHTKQAWEETRNAAVRALTIDEQVAEAHSELGWMQLCHDWDLVSSERELQRAITLNPLCGTAHHYYSHYLTVVGRRQDSLDETERYLALGPFDGSNNAHRGFHYIYSREYDEAIRALREAITVDPSYPWSHLYLGIALSYARAVDEAVGEFQSVVQATGSTMALSRLGHVSAMTGHADRAREILHQLEVARRDRYVPPYDIALVHLGLGEVDLALNELSRACDERNHWVVYLDIEPVLDPIRHDSRFHKLVDRLGFRRSGAAARDA